MFRILGKFKHFWCNLLCLIECICHIDKATDNTICHCFVFSASQLKQSLEKTISNISVAEYDNDCGYFTRYIFHIIPNSNTANYDLSKVFLDTLQEFSIKSPGSSNEVKIQG